MTFKILRKLGHKTKRKFNEVYLVEIIENKQLGVLKQLIKSDSNLHIQDLLRNEAQFEFQNRNLPKTLYFEENEEQISLVKNYFEGEALEIYWQKIAKKDRISFLCLFIQKIQPIFQELKDRSIVHGDIKPTNFIIKGVGLSFDVYLIDFGLSFCPSDFDKSKNSRKVVFALGFSAPELILNKLNVANQSTDLFALGICIYFLFEGKLPLSHPNPAIMTNLQLVHPLVRPNSISNDLFQVLKKMCHKESFAKPANLMSNEEIEFVLKKGISKRYESVNEIYNDLNQIRLKRERTVLGRLIKIFSKP
jgi:serine/threonine protein kinase